MLLFVFSCNEDELQPETDVVQSEIEELTEYFEDSSNTTIDEQFKEINLDLETKIKTLKGDDNFVDLLSDVVSLQTYFSSSIAGFNPEQREVAKKQLVDAGSEGDLGEIAEAFRMDTNEFNERLDEIVTKLEVLRESNPMLLEADSNELNLMAQQLDQDETFSAKVRNTSKFKRCRNLCIAGVSAGCALITGGGLMRKLASCLGMTGLRMKVCIAGVIAEQVGVGVVCAITYVVCAEKCALHRIEELANGGTSNFGEQKQKALNKLERCKEAFGHANQNLRDRGIRPIPSGFRRYNLPYWGHHTGQYRLPAHWWK